MHIQGGSPPVSSDAEAGARCYYNEKIVEFRQHLNSFVDEQGVPELHALRTATRRLEAALRARSDIASARACRRYQRKVKRLFRRSSLLRDGDVITAKLKKLGVKKNSDLLRVLRQTRKAELPGLLNRARKLQELKLPQTDIQGEANLRQPIAKHVQRFLDLRPAVVASEEMIEEVHEMRKDAKKLFYLLEQDEKLGSLRQLIGLKMFQRLTGEIHDADVAMAFLKRQSGSVEVADLLETLACERHLLYRKLVGLLQDEEWTQLQDLLSDSP